MITHLHKGKKMELTVMERMGILQILSPEGDLIYLRAKRELVGKVGLTADEILEFKVVEVNERMRWDMTVPQEKEIDLSNGEIAMVSDVLKKHVEDKKLHENHLSLYEKLVEN
ncbi:hypothetical protein LCGC14_3007170 [marine sediment metagenome]|uniref:Uncharacterized protein n=1 Tax=marine sediment metagenome TaxID=412755 RepID=A0A0F8Z6Y6_9ZZZZ